MREQMLCLENKRIAVYVEESGGLTIEDKHRGETWSLDPQTQVYANPDGCYGMEAEFHPSHMAGARKQDGILEISIEAGGQCYPLQVRLRETYVELALPAIEDPRLGALAFPGSFRPNGGESGYILPIMQGMWWDGRGEAWESRFGEAGHTGFVMPMFGVAGRRGALLTVAETADDCLWWAGKDASGRMWAANIQIESLGSMRYERKLRLYPTDASVTAVGKQYRAYVQEKGRFASWQEKMKERPGLSRLFGSIMCFIGYCQDDLDYAAECEKLKACGFEKALLYPMRFNTYSQDFLMGGYEPIHLDQNCVARIKALGYDVAPWTWINEGLDDGTESMGKRFRLVRDGSRQLSWQIDDSSWYACCTAQMEDFLREQNEAAFADMTWEHFDVVACATNRECHGKNHPGHPGGPLSKTEDRAFIRKLLLAGRGRDGQKFVSSENFNDAYSLEYDMGSVKAWPQFGPWPFWPVPLTGLVYHDSILHTWWEPHNYNSRYFDRDVSGRYQYGGGRPRLMASMDALYGCVPDVFPFGAMYGWEGDGAKTFLYRIRFEDPETRFALELALPVAKHHARVGMLEMTGFSFLSEDGILQKTTFSDGTEVYANLGTQGARMVEGVGSLQSESWRAVYPD